MTVRGSSGLLVRLTGRSASSAVQRNQPGQAADSKLVVGPFSERMKVKRLSSSLVLLRSVMLMFWKARNNPVISGGPESPGCLSLYLSSGCHPLMTDKWSLETWPKNTGSRFLKITHIEEIVLSSLVLKIMLLWPW